jgi:hypothetical protein
MEEEIKNDHSDIENEYSELMKDFNPVDIILNSKWEKRGDFFEQYSIYDYSQ